MKGIGVHFKYNGKVNYYLPKKEEKYYIGQNVVVEYNKETVVTKITLLDKELDEKELQTPLKEIVRIATAEDLKKVEQGKKKAEEAVVFAREKVAELNLPMKVLDCEISLCGRALFHFTAEDRVDFRELVRILATAMRCRIELRQVSQREVVREMGGMGSCGRACCCTQGVANIQKVSIKMAKEQALSLNMAKLSGVCGKLKCCLSYENDFYVQTMKTLPPMGAKVKTPEGEGNVVALNIPKYLVSVKLQNNNGTLIKNFTPDTIEVLESTKPNKIENKTEERQPLDVAKDIDTNLE